MDATLVLERITFRQDGGSRHEYEFADGTVNVREFEVSPVLFRKEGVFGFDTAKSRGVSYIERRFQT